MNFLYIFLFYTFIAIIFFLNRKKVINYYYIIYLLRTKIGIKLLDRIKNWKIWSIFSIISIILGFTLIVSAIILIFYGLINKYYRTVLLIPGTRIPSLGIEIPFFPVIIAIFIVAFIHEFAHGILIRKYKVKVKNTGLLLFGPFLGAFVEPDEKEVEKLPTLKQIAIYNAGSVANILTGIIFLVISIFAIPHLINSQINSQYVVITHVLNNSPAKLAGVSNGERIISLNNKNITSIEELAKILSEQTPGSTITLVTNKSKYNITLGMYNISKRTCMGVIVKEKRIPKNKAIYYILMLIEDIFKWLTTISIGIGIANMLPILPIDGGRTIYALLKEEYGEDRAKKYITYISIIMSAVLIINISLSYITPHAVIQESCRIPT